MQRWDWTETGMDTDSNGEFIMVDELEEFAKKHFGEKEVEYDGVLWFISKIKGEI